MRLVTKARLANVNRIAAPIFGGYIFAYGLLAACTLVGFSLGLSFFEAQGLASLVSLVAYLCAVLWGVWQTSARVWLVLCGGGGGFALLAWALSRSLG